MPTGAEVIRQIKSRITEVDPSEVREAAASGNGDAPVIVDVRESEEFEGGRIPGAKHVPRGHLESRIEGAAPDRSQRVVLYCASGNRSALAANTLQELLGYERVESMTGGYTLWKDRGYEVEQPRSLTREQRDRYSRHLLVPEIGLEGQQKLLDAKVLLLGAGVMARFAVHLPETGATPDDYEAILSPIYAWMHALTQRSEQSVVSAGAGASARAWVALSGGPRRARSLPDVALAAALGAGFAGAVAAVNAAGIGPVRRDLSGAGLRRGGLRGIAEALRRLGVTAPHVLWGHSHRAGPWPRDDRSEWRTASGTQIHNTGSWVYQRHFLTDEVNGSPYWPGTAIEVDSAGGPPRLRRLLGDRGHDELRPR